jgi:hypothetical protein
LDKYNRQEYRIVEAKKILVKYPALALKEIL